MMGMFALYAGLAGGFGGATYQGTEEFDTEEEAMDAAYQLATEIFESYSGLYGVVGFEDIMEDPETYGIENFDSLSEDEQYNIINEILRDECESWIDFYVEERFEYEEE